MTKYSIISTEKRQKLIKDVVQLKFGIARTARKLKIKLSTAKSILRAFKSKGKILIKKNIKSRKNIQSKKIETNLSQETPKIDGITQQSQQKKLENSQNIQITQNYQSFNNNFNSLEPFSNFNFAYFNWMPIIYPFCY